MPGTPEMPAVPEMPDMPGELEAAAPAGPRGGAPFAGGVDAGLSHAARGVAAAVGRGAPGSGAPLPNCTVKSMSESRTQTALRTAAMPKTASGGRSAAASGLPIGNVATVAFAVASKTRTDLSDEDVTARSSE